MLAKADSETAVAFKFVATLTAAAPDSLPLEDLTELALNAATADSCAVCTLPLAGNTELAFTAANPAS